MGVPHKDGQNRAPMRATIDLDAVPQSVTEARNFVATMLDVWGCDDPDEVVGLLTTEVVTNAVRHAGGHIRVLAALAEDGTVRIETYDESPNSPVVQRPDVYAEGGRGILIVQTLARRWGVDASDSEKVVWFELPTIPRKPRPRC